MRLNVAMQHPIPWIIGNQPDEDSLKDGYVDGILHLTKLRTHTISRDHLKPMAMKVEWVFGRRNVTDLDHGIMTEW